MPQSVSARDAKTVIRLLSQLCTLATVEQDPGVNVYLSREMFDEIDSLTQAGTDPKYAVAIVSVALAKLESCLAGTLYDSEDLAYCADRIGQCLWLMPAARAHLADLLRRLANGNAKADLVAAAIQATLRTLPKGNA